MNYTDRIFPTNKGLTTYIEELINKNYQIPTFQRDVVWEKYNVKKLWDSIYKFYPLGSILIWKTPLKLHNHRSIGGNIITDNLPRSEYQYILDGQQRTTSLLTSLYGGKIEGRDSFNPQLYVDLTIQNTDEVDDESFTSRFLFWDEIDDRNGEIKQNTGRNKRYHDKLIVKLNDIKTSFSDIERQIVNNTLVNGNDYDSPVRKELRKIKEVLDNYRISFIEVKGIQVSEVCQIFERINQAGKPLNIFDIVVAKTFVPKTEIDTGFYLRELIDDFKTLNNSKFMDITDMDYLQILAVLINQNIEGNSVRNITDRYLNEIKTEQIIGIWDKAKKAILKTFDFFENHLHIQTPYLLPYRYLYFTISNYFYRSDNPDYLFLKKYFWFYCLHNDDLLSNTTHLFGHIEFLNNYIKDGTVQFNTFVIDKNKLRESSYSSKGRLSRAILSLYASKAPKDWEHCSRDVIVPNLFISTDTPNLHHVFPTNSEYVLTNSSINNNSLMNIVYLTQMTNLDISNRNPVEYFKDYISPDFINIMPSHFLPEDIIHWANSEILPDDALSIFIEKRIDLIINEIKEKLNGIQVEVIDTKIFV